MQDILAHITKKEFEALLAVDQLNLEREKNKVFLRFSECGGKGTAPRTKTAAPSVPADLSLCHLQHTVVPCAGTALRNVPKAWGTLTCTTQAPRGRSLGSVSQEHASTGTFRGGQGCQPSA